MTNTATLNVTGEKHFRRGADERPWAPGNSPGLVTINSHVMLAGTLDMELGGVLRATPGTGGAGYHDAMNVTRALALDGTLNVLLSDGFTPSYGDSFSLLETAALSDDFETVNLPALSSDLSWQRTQSATGVTITVVPGPTTGAISSIATAALRPHSQPRPCAFSDASCPAQDSGTVVPMAPFVMRARP